MLDTILSNYHCQHQQEKTAAIRHVFIELRVYKRSTAASGTSYCCRSSDQDIEAGGGKFSSSTGSSSFIRAEMRRFLDCLDHTFNLRIPQPQQQFLLISCLETVHCFKRVRYLRRRQCINHLHNVRDELDIHFTML